MDASFFFSYAHFLGDSSLLLFELRSGMQSDASIRHH
jgi:hypothetical protein